MTRLTDAELSNALDCAQKATPGPWDYEEAADAIMMPSCPSPGQQAYGLERYIIPEDTFKFIATMNPEFASRVIKELQWHRSGELHTCHDKCGRVECVRDRELVWAREMLERAKDLIEFSVQGECRDEKVDEYRWLRVLAKGPV